MLKLEIIGNVGQDAVMKSLAGKNFVSFSVAHSEKIKAMNNQIIENTVWVSVLSTQENLLQYLKSGSKVFVRGNMRVNQYTDKSGNSRVSIEVYASEIQLCDLKKTARQDTPMTAASYQQKNVEPDNLPF